MRSIDSLSGGIVSLTMMIDFIPTLIRVSLNQLIHQAIDMHVKSFPYVLYMSFKCTDVYCFKQGFIFPYMFPYRKIVHCIYEKDF